MLILNVVDGDIECSSNSSYTRKYQNHVPCSFAYKVVCVKLILNEYNYCRKVFVEI